MSFLLENNPSIKNSNTIKKYLGIINYSKIIKLYIYEWYRNNT